MVQCLVIYTLTKQARLLPGTQASELWELLGLHGLHEQLELQDPHAQRDLHGQLGRRSRRVPLEAGQLCLFGDGCPNDLANKLLEET